jgi:hypothetical protein
VAELGDGGVVEVEEAGADAVGVFAVVGAGAVEAAADVGWCFGEPDGVFLDGPGADLGLGEVGEPVEVGELRVVLVAVFGCLADAGWHVACLECVHELVGVVLLGCRAEQFVEASWFSMRDWRVEKRWSVLQAGVNEAIWAAPPDETADTVRKRFPLAF